LHSVQLQAWEWALVDGTKRSPYAEVVVAVLVTPPAAHEAGSPPTNPSSRAGVENSAAHGLLGHANEILENRVILEPDAFASRDGIELIADVPTTRAGPIRDGGICHWEEKDLARLRQYGVDVFISLTPLAWTAGLAAAARYGVWSITHGDERSGFGNPAGFWEVHFGCPVISSTVQVVNGRDTRPRIISRSFSATDMTSVKRTKNNVHWKAASLLPSKLEELQRTGPESFFDRVDAAISNCSGPANALRQQPTRLELARHISRICGRGLRTRLRQRLFLPQWVLLYHFGDGVSTRMRDFRQIVPPKDRYWADPHVVLRDGSYYIFFEELPFATNKGHISVLRIDPQGRPDAPMKVLERPYHLSYPHMVEDGGELFMVPETAENRTIEIYRCTRFPDQWELAGTLMEGVCAVDATLLQRDGKWWLFANVVENAELSTWDQLFLFHSDSLAAGTWIPHPLNPIVSDVRRARPAGPIFEREGRLYRPSQDCSVRYGYGIRINQITTLTPDDYAEIESDSIWPDWDTTIIATHTLCHVGGLTVADALQPRLKL
jgi:hypothetical protein